MRALLFCLTLLLCSCCRARYPSAGVAKYLHDDAYRLVYSGYASEPAFSDIYVFKTSSSTGYDTQIFADELSCHPWVLHSSARADIDKFTETLRRGGPEFPERIPGETFHVVLKVAGTSNAVYFQVFVARTSEPAAWISGGTDPKWSIRSAAAWRWCRAVTAASVPNSTLERTLTGGDAGAASRVRPRQ